MGKAILRFNEVSKAVGLGRTSIYKFMNAGMFPRSVRIGPKAVGWRAAEIEAWIASRPQTEQQSA